MNKRRGTQKNPQDWLNAALDTLATEGIGGVRVERLAKKIGVTKGSFYWHFPHRPALLAALLAHWEKMSTHDIIARVNHQGGTADKRLRNLWEVTSSHGFDRAELAIRGWSTHDPLARAAVDRVDAARLAFLRSLLVQLGYRDEDAEARGLLLYSLLIGDLFIGSHHGPLQREAVLQSALALLLEAPAQHTAAPDPPQTQ